MADDDVITEQIRQLTVTDRYRVTDDGDVLMPSVNTRMLDPGDGAAVQTIVLDQADLMATDEFLQLARSAERLNSNVGQSLIATSKLRQLLDPETANDQAQPAHDTTITERPPFAARDDDSG